MSESPPMRESSLDSSRAKRSYRISERTPVLFGSLPEGATQIQAVYVLIRIAIINPSHRWLISGNRTRRFMEHALTRVTSNDDGGDSLPMVTIQTNRNMNEHRPSHGCHTQNNRRDGHSFPSLPFPDREWKQLDPTMNSLNAMTVTVVSVSLLQST